MDLKNSWRDAGVGTLIGIGAIAPGISGGALAVLCGYYPRITGALSDLFRKPKEAFRFLIPLGVGTVVGVLLGGKLLGYLFAQFPSLLQWSFVGLIAGTLPSLWRDANRDGCRWWYMFPALAGLLFTLLGNWLPPLPEGEVSFGKLLLTGAVLGAGTIIPGVSSTCLLVFLGLYAHYLKILNTLAIRELWPIVLAFGITILLLAGAVNWCYKKAYGLTSYTVLGFLCGSAVLILPDVPTDTPSLLTAGAVLIGSCVLSWMIARMAERKNRQWTEKRCILPENLL